MSARDRRSGPDRRLDFADFGPPIRIPGGVRARSQRGDIARTWWSRRFLDALEHYYGADASRLARGRAYARAGQVVRIDLSPGLVTAPVQGSRPVPYAVSITVRELDDAAWAKAETAMAARAVFLARLLAGEMPDEIEEAFEAAGLRLFPARRGDLTTACSCPDTANPCKHIAAVYYLLAEAFDANPFLVFEWRGRSRERLIAELRALRPSAAAASARAGGSAPSAAAPGSAAAGGSAAPRHRPGSSGTAAGPADRSLAGFWDGGAGWAEVPIDARPTSPPDALLREADAEVVRALGGDTIVALRGLYQRASGAARRRLDPPGAAPTTASGGTRPRATRGPGDGARQRPT